MKNQETHVDQKRRAFLKLSGILGLGAASAALLHHEKVEALLFNKKEYMLTETKLAMGSFVSVSAIHPSRDEAQEAIGLAFDEMNRLCKLLTHYEPDSPVGTLNRTGRLEAAPQEVLDVMAKSLYFNRETGGAFDISVLPVVNLYQESFAAGRTPAEAEIDRVARLVDSRDIQYQEGTLFFKRSDMAITFNAIAAGYMVDRMSEVLRSKGVVNHLINATGEIRVSGKAGGGKPWTVAVQDPNKSRHYPSVISMQDGAISTSGNYEVYYDKEKLFHHIVTPQTGHSPHLFSSVTVMAQNCVDADALSTGVFVLEKEGLKFIEQRPGYECFVVDRDGNCGHTSGWPA